MNLGHLKSRDSGSQSPAQPRGKTAECWRREVIPSERLQWMLVEGVEVNAGHLGSRVTDSCFLGKEAVPRMQNFQWKVLQVLAQLCPILWDPVVCSLPGSSVQGILQARILEWVASPSSRVSSPLRDQTRVSLCLLHCRRILYHWATCKVLGRPYREGRLRSPSEGPKCFPKAHKSPPEFFKTLGSAHPGRKWKKAGVSGDLGTPFWIL